jgi:uncharacterized phage protein (TIGR02218 family)
MRTLGPDFAAHLASGATTLANCWRIVRGDGVTLGFTDHDEPLVFDGTSFEPMLEGGEAAEKLGGQTATAEVVGVLVSDRIAEDDILLGRYDGALVETWRVNWREVSQRLLLRRASIGEITREDGAFRAELRSGQQALNRVSGRLYQKLCDAQVGDARCGVDLEDPAFRAEIEVTAVADRFRLQVAGLDGFEEGWFGLGQARWESGRRQGLIDPLVGHRRIGGVDLLGFAAPVGDWVEVGDFLTVTAGCDRRLATCREKFANVVNFRGFPHVPGNDFVLRYPREDNPLDGRALYR